MATNLTDFREIFRAFIGDDEDQAYNNTSLDWHLYIGAQEAGFNPSAYSPPTIPATLSLTTTPGQVLLLVAWAARSLLLPRAQVKSFGAGSPRRSFTFDNPQAAVQRAIAYIRDNDPNITLPSDSINDIYAVLQADRMRYDTAVDALAQ